jgi:hypothetical protein
MPMPALSGGDFS